MPKVSDNYGPIYQTVTLNGAGFGGVSFQAVGSAIRVSNIFFKVATAAAQATCTIYKGQVADGNNVFLSNNGSTGGNAKGNVDLFDGETLWVVWTGGDPGALATATFSGIRLNFDEMQPSNLSFEDAVAAADGSLIFPAIKSPNFVQGSSGWRISRNGDAEFNDVDIRGTFTATGNNGNFISLVTGNTAIIEMRPPNFVNAPIPSTEIEPGTLVAVTHDNNPDGALGLVLSAPGWNPAGGAANKKTPQIILLGPLYSGSFQSAIFFQNDVDDADVRFVFSGDVYCENDLFLSFSPVFGNYGVDSGQGRVNGNGSSSNSASIGATETSVLTIPSFTYKAGRAYEARISSELVVLTAAPNRPAVRLRKTNTAGTQLGAYGHYVSGTSSMHFGGGTCEFYVTGSDVTAALVITLAGGAGYTVNTTASPPLSVSIYDIGEATSISGYAVQLS
jgi:hypothetical protein